MGRLSRLLGLTALLGALSLSVLASDDWKSLYQAGKLNTPYKHFSVIAEGVAGRDTGQYGGKPGPAFLGMRVWASSAEEARDMTRLFAERVGFALKGKIEVYDTEPIEPPRDAPHAYSIKFTPYAARKK